MVERSKQYIKVCPSHHTTTNITTQVPMSLFIFFILLSLPLPPPFPLSPSSTPLRCFFSFCSLDKKHSVTIVLGKNNL